MKTLLTTLHSKYVHASLALPYLASYCGSDCGEFVIEEYTIKEPKESILGQIVSHQADVVCFSVYLWNRLETLELVECLKRIDPVLKVVLGGPDISFEGGAFFDRYPVDALICGEGERPLYQLLKSWHEERPLRPLDGLKTPHLSSDGACNDQWSLLESLDDIPSPFAAGLTDLTRGLVYFESSRGCPYRCSFCMSALDQKVRSFSMERIKSDLLLLMENDVPLVKFVDRTFNYEGERSREIFSFILKHNRCSRFHFEIGAHLLDQQTLELLATVPDDVFQFEIGVQSTLPQTLNHVGRHASLQRLADNVRFLTEQTDIHLHLDLIAGLPGESFEQFLSSIDWVHDLGGNHLQIEPVKLLPGAPLRNETERWGIAFDPNPPYSILRSESMSFHDLERLRGIGRLFDLLVNSERFNFLLKGLISHFGRISLVLNDLDLYWREHELYRQSRSLRDLYLTIDGYLCTRFADCRLKSLRELLGRDFAHHERVVSGRAPAFFDVVLTAEEEETVRKKVKDEVFRLQRSGKIQYFASAFHHLPGLYGRRILIFLYVQGGTAGSHVREVML